MKDETSIRAVIPCPDGGTIVTLGFPGLAFDVKGDAIIDPERMAATLSAPALETCKLLVILVEKTEVPEEAWDLLTKATAKTPYRFVHLPIEDYQVPDETFMADWATLAGEIDDHLTAGATIALSCHYGAGRSGTIAASMLIDRGLSMDAAIAEIRSRFADSIESEKQLTWLAEVERAARARG